MKKERYEEPEMRMIIVEKEDVVTASNELPIQPKPQLGGELLGIDE